MASLEQRFRAIERERPYHSSLLNFNRAIQGIEMSQARLNFYFRKLVEKDDYAKEDFREIRKLYTTQNPTTVKPYFGEKTSESHQLCLA